MGWFASDTTAVSEPSITDSAMVSENSWQSVPLVTISPNTGAVQNNWVGSNTFSNVTWTTTNTGGWGMGSGAGEYQVNNDLKGGQLHLEGDGADIHINGESLMKTLQALEQRLNILRPNTELEAEWDQLRELGDQYRQLETELMEKQKMWNKLKEIQTSTP
jgi:hypothetical protein